MTGNSTDEFIELYNPTAATVELTGWKVVKLTASGIPTILAASLSGILQPNSYFLLAHENSTATESADFIFNNGSLASNNTVVLYENDGVTVADLVGMGTATASESATIGNPPNGKSIERKALATSSAQSMMIGGVDEFLGNGFDSNNNAVDFIVRDNPEPQNSFDVEPLLTPTPTPMQTATPTQIPPSPTSTPTVIPTVTMMPLPTLMPTPTLTPLPTPQQPFRFFIMACHTFYRTFHFFGRMIHWPYIACRA